MLFRVDGNVIDKKIHFFSLYFKKTVYLHVFPCTMNQVGITLNLFSYTFPYFYRIQIPIRENYINLRNLYLFKIYKSATPQYSQGHCH